MHTKIDSSNYLYGFTLLLVASFGCASSDNGQPPAQRPVAVRVAPPERIDLRQTLSYVGTVRFERTVRVSSQIPGVLDEQLAPEGAIVERGQRLGRILAPELATRVSQVQAETRRARAERDFVCDTLKTDERLEKAGAIEPLKVETTRKNCASATEAVRSAEARGAEVRAASGRTIEESPDDGSILSWLVEPGEYVGPGKPLVMLGTGRKLATVQVAEPDLRRGIEPGMAVELRSGDEAFAAVVTHVAPVMTGPSRSSIVEVALPDSLAALPDGASIDVDFLIDSAADVVVVPERALVESDAGTYVFVHDAGKARRVDVIAGLRAGGLVEVSGLPADANLVLTQVRSLSDGTPIYTVEAIR